MSYCYEPLSNPKEQLRLMKLEPGRPEDPIAFWLQPVTVLPPDDASLTTQSKAVATSTDSLSSGWSSMETMSRRILYKREDTGETSWENPSPDPVSALSDQLRKPCRSTTSAVVEFEALSYTWGDSTITETAIVRDPANPTSDDRALDIRENLALALRHLRKPNQSRTLWVDAVCINQCDDVEKSHQVARMDRVYRLAHRVVVWLGPSSDGSDKAMAALRYLGEQVELSRNSVRARAPGAKEPEWYRSEVKLPWTEDVFEAIAALFKRPYFERLWIL